MRFAPRFVSFSVYALLGACSSSSTPPAASNPDTGAEVGTDTGGDVDVDGGADAATADPCSAFKGKTVTLDPATAKEDDVAKAFVTAAPGDVIELGAGTFTFTNGLSIATNCVTVRGAGLDKTTLDFSGQLAGSEGIYGDHSNDLVLEGFTVKDTKGNAIKVLGGERVTFRKVQTTWTGAEPTKHGAYGLYPVQSKYVLIEECIASGASDSGIYVGQSDFVVVRNNRAENNVAGIEIENTFDAEVHDNVATHNTAGILVFDLPGLPQLGGHSTRVFKNTMKDNNTPNFAPDGNIVGMVPAGVGFLVMANHDVEIDSNTVDGNATVNGAVVSYYVTQIAIKDTKYYPYPAKIHVHDNTFVGGGDAPDPKKDLGVLLMLSKDKFPGGVVADVLYDGILDDKVMGPAANPMQICVKGNKDATFANLHLDKLPSTSLDVSSVWSLDAAPYDCSLPTLPRITWSGLTP
ncbi:MAG: parallel beta-helix domain-containing protein [Polyangiales bacterium]